MAQTFLGRMFEDCGLDISKLMSFGILQEKVLNRLNVACERVYHGHVGAPSEDLYHYVIDHSERVARYALPVATQRMATEDCYKLALAAFLHDFDKFSWEEDLMLKPWADLNDMQHSSILQHPLAGAAYLNSVTGRRMPKDVLDAIRCHHELFDGTGHPSGQLKGNAIPLAARILCVADSYDAMTTQRVYREGTKTKEEALAEIEACMKAGKYDPDIAALFLKSLPNTAV